MTAEQEKLAQQAPEQMLAAALDALRFEHAHAEASRSRASGLLTACGVLLALTVGLGSTASQAAQKLTSAGATVAVIASALAALCLLAAAVLSGLVFLPSQETGTPWEELRELTELLFREPDERELAEQGLIRLNAAREANLRSRGRILHAVVLYLTALGFLGAQVLTISAVHLLGL